MTRRLLLVRHGVTTWNREGRFQGHLDPPLDETGVLQAHLLADRLATEEADGLRIVSSPLERALATARILAEAMDGVAEPGQDPRLMEIGQGEWEGRTHADLAVADAERYATWRSGGGSALPPGGEPLEAAERRAMAAIAELVADVAEAICVVSHGGILRLAARALLNLELARAWAMDVDNASISRLTLGDDAATWRLDAWNDTGHLLGRTPIHLDEADGAPLAL